MRAAAVFREFGQQPVIEELETPTPQGDESVAEVIRSSITHIDRAVASGNFAMCPQLPYIGGVEGLVAVNGSRHLIRGGGVGLQRDGCWTTHAIVPNDALLPVPADLDDDTAAVFLTPAATAARAVEIACVSEGQVVVVTGASGVVGSLVAQMCISLDAKVVGIVGSRSKAGFAHGDRVIVGRGGDAAEQLPERPDVLIDTVGGKGLVPLIMSVRRGGRAVMLGDAGGSTLTLDLTQWFYRDVSLWPVDMLHAESWVRANIEMLAARFSSGELVIRTDTVALTEIPKAFESLATGAVAGRLVVDPHA